MINVYGVTKKYNKPPNGRAPRFLKNKNKGTQSQYFRPLQTLSCTSESSCFRLSYDTFEADQDRALADYIELSLQLQFNNRSRSHA